MITLMFAVHEKNADLVNGGQKWAFIYAIILKDMLIKQSPTQSARLRILPSLVMANRKNSEGHANHSADKKPIQPDRNLRSNLSSLSFLLLCLFLAACGGSETVDNVQSNNNDPLPVTDNTPPIIQLSGYTPVTLELSSLYNDVGATAFDTVDGDISEYIVMTSDVDVNTIGSYQVLVTSTAMAV